jgi:peptide/nickel transport system permease protein
MVQYMVRRLLYLIPLWIGVSVIVFVLMRIMPGDVAVAMLGEEGVASLEELASIRQALGTDQPIPVQYWRWLKKKATLDFGTSMYGSQPVLEVIFARAPPTINLAILATVIAVIIGIPLGVLSAVKRNTIMEYFIRVVSILGLALPSFWLGILISLTLALCFHWSVPFKYMLPWEDPVANMQKMIWPALIMGYHEAAMVARMTRSTMLDVLGEDYIRTAYAKGLRNRVVLIKHGLRNALIPVVTVVGIHFALILAGVVVLEMVFSIPGIGSLLVESIRRRDYPVVEILLLGTSTVVMLVNLLVEATYALLDPRISHS